MAVRVFDLRTGAGTAEGYPVHYFQVDTEAEKPSGLLNLGDILYCRQNGCYYVARNNSVWSTPLRQPVEFSKTAVVLNPASAVNIMAWSAPFSCTVTGVKGHRTGGTGALVNARRNGASAHLAVDLSLTSAGSWMDGGAVQNTAYIGGDRLELMVTSLSGSPTQVAIELELTRP